jgi:hypothetical protein
MYLARVPKIGGGEGARISRAVPMTALAEASAGFPFYYSLGQPAEAVGWW